MNDEILGLFFFYQIASEIYICTRFSWLIRERNPLNRLVYENGLLLRYDSVWPVDFEGQLMLHNDHALVQQLGKWNSIGIEDHLMN